VQLIVGHTTNDSAWIWVRGDPNHRRLTLVVEAIQDAEGRQPAPPAERELEVDPAHDYIAVVRFESLAPNTRYAVRLTSAGREVVSGQLRTFPELGTAVSFRFLHGSCNLPVARLTALGSMAAALLGSAATDRALELPFSDWDLEHLTGFKRVLRWPGVRAAARGLIKALNKVVLWYAFRTRFEQPKPLLPSPFARLSATAHLENDSGPRHAFMIHCGDQIYYDLDFPQREGSTKDYARSYRQAWFNDAHAARFLRSLPQYMTLDDHEIVDGFGTNPEPSASEIEPAVRAYEHYVSSRQPARDPAGGFYYTFEYGDAGFFVLDTRTKRSAEERRMLSESQLVALERWLSGEEPHDKPYELKFIVSSVPFVAQLRPPGLDRNRDRRGDGRADKWSGAAWRSQRDRIISAIYENNVNHLVFLVGDMHCTYHARMLIGDPRRRVTVHELAGGPLNQLQFAKRDDFYARYTGTSERSSGTNHSDESTNQSKRPPLSWTSTLEAFNGASPSVLDISVRPQSSSAPTEIRWTAVRTHAAPVERDVRGHLSKPQALHDLCGRIRFHRQPMELW